jgi:hypothetical protein
MRGFRTALPPLSHCGAPAEARKTLSDTPLKDGPSIRAAAAQRAEAALVATVEQLRLKLGLSHSTAELVKDIKATMHVALPPFGMTVIQTLCEREREKVFNHRAADVFPGIHAVFVNAIQDFVVVRDGATPTRKARRIAQNAWKADRAADRRVKDSARPDDAGSPHRGRPEKYDSGVLWAFAEAIARAAGREQFSTGHHGDATFTRDNKAGEPMFRVLVAAIQWAMTMAWQGCSPPGSEAPFVIPEGVLTVIKRSR